MNGISPRPRFFLQPEMQISSTVLTAVPELPQVVTDLIAEYTNEDYSQATQPLIFDETGQLVDHAENRGITAAIRKALVSTSCDPAIKRCIFKNHNENLTCESNYAAILNTIFDEIRSDNEQINLDKVDFSEIHLVRLDLTGASMIGAGFNNSLVYMTNLAYADLTDAVINNSDFTVGNMTGASLIGSTLFNVIFSEFDMVRTDTSRASLIRIDFNCVAADGMITDNNALQEMIDASARNLDEVSAGSELDSFLKTRFLAHPKPQSNSITVLHDHLVQTASAG